MKPSTTHPTSRLARRPCARLAAALFPLAILSQSAAQSPLQERYTKTEHQIPMRDGVKLFTAVYAPKDTSRTYPFLMRRTPYGVGPYGEGQFSHRIGPSDLLEGDGYIFVLQDVRGTHMSEGTFVNMTPHVPDKKSPSDVDESSDAHDTIAWLLEHVPNHNGRVGMWGISYPGFYSSASMIDAHPALKAVSPQAPIADWFFDDFHHHGAFYLPHAFNFIVGFGKPRPLPVQHRPWGFSHGTPDGYDFYLNLGPLCDVPTKHFQSENPMWDEIVEHPDYDEYWRKRNILPHLKKVAPAVMTVGGWYDAEDLYGTFETYAAIERQNPGVFNILVAGPWDHGGWGRRDGDRLGNLHFGEKTSVHYQEQIERVFFNHFLKDEGTMTLSEAHLFETGENRWRTFPQWPPKEAQMRRVYPAGGGALTFDAPTVEGFDEFISDPAKPVPYTEEITVQMTREHMTDDQRFAARRPDVLTYQTSVLTEPLTLAGPIAAELWVSTTQTDADWIIKVIDVFPPDAKAPEGFSPSRPWGGYQMMVRSEVIRGRYRDSYEKPAPFRPGEPTRVRLKLQDVLHTFKPGHRLMIQVQSTWFPLVDRNPQKYVPNIYKAVAEDFVKATHRVYRSPRFATHFEVGVLPAEPTPAVPPAPAAGSPPAG
ncbi:MAG: Cocaine esterase [Phycisphaerae bacterium]|nr:Cocaine esterase [Phycisphaerae bacterium]